MGRTATQWIADTAFSDAQQPVGPDFFQEITTGASTLAFANGTIQRNVAASQSSILVATLDLLSRTGYAPLYQEQYGTKASVPGPSAVAGTSDPLAISGYPPFLSAKIPTRFPQSGYVPKGTQVNSVFLAYRVVGVALTSISIGIYQNYLNSGVNPTTVAVIPQGANGLPVAALAGSNCYTTTIQVPTPAMNVLTTAPLELNIQFVTPAGSTVNFYGASLNISYNFN